MATTPEWRHLARLTRPPWFNACPLAHQPIRLVVLSPTRARSEHADPLQAGLLCFVGLPPTLARGTLSGRVVWSKPRRDEQTRESARHQYYQSGLSWTGLTPEQGTGVMAALELLRAAR